MVCTMRAEPLDLRLPTENHHLLTGAPERFYMYVDRYFEGEASKPWEAGSYGFVRTAQRINGNVLLTKFHEGIDIAPVKRDAAGNPLDIVSSIAAGRVVHTSPLAGRSNYGKYVVVEHTWENSPVLSLYAHLADVTCQPGDVVSAGTALGKMGFTGAGINRTRAHCHLELALLIHSRFDGWQKNFSGGTNYHGLYNGMNLAGADVARFFLEHKDNPQVRFSEFIARTPVYFKVTVPVRGPLELIERYPWMHQRPTEPATSWEISFSATGMPIAVEPSDREVTTAIVSAVRPSEAPHRYLTRDLINGEGNHATLSQSGLKLIALVTGDFPAAP